MNSIAWNEKSQKLRGNEKKKKSKITFKCYHPDDFTTHTLVWKNEMEWKANQMDSKWKGGLAETARMEKKNRKTKKK